MSMRAALFLSVSAFAATAATVPVFAQTAPAAAAETRRVETIVVTARKAEETLQDAPVAVTAFTEESIQNLNITSIDDVARFTPGLSFSRAFGRVGERPVVRGQANILAGVQPGVEAGAAYFVDGVYFAGDIQSLDLQDVQRVEVIKGPQSALYGRNTYSGAINFITKAPSDSFEWSFKAEVAEHEQHDVTLRLAGPLMENLSGSLSVRSFAYGGEFQNSRITIPTDIAARVPGPLAPTYSALGGETVGDESTFSISGALDWTPIDSFRLRGRLAFNQDRDGPRAFGFQKSDLNNCFPGFRSNAFRGIAATTDNNPNQYFCGVLQPVKQVAINTGVGGTFKSAPFYGVERDLWTGSLIAEIEPFADHTLTVQGGFRTDDRKVGSDSDFQNGANPAFQSFNPVLPRPAGFAPTTVIQRVDAPFYNSQFQETGYSEVNDYSLEARLQSPSDRRFRWLVGAYFYDQREESFGLNWAFPADQGYRGPRSRIATTSNVSAYGRLSYDILETVSLDLELRTAVETRRRTEFEVGIADFGGAAGFDAATNQRRQAGAIVYDDKREFESTTPRVTLTWKPNDDLTLYGIFAQGVKPGGLNGLTGLLNGFPTFEQEESDNYEIGAKGVLFDARVSYAISLYTTDVGNYQLTTNAANSLTGALTSVVTNQGVAKVDGAEFEGRWIINDLLDVGFTYAWTDARFEEGCDPDQYMLTSGGFLMGLANRPRVPGAAVLPTANCSIAGKKIPLTSEHQASFNVNYEQPLFDDGAFYVRADVSYESEKFTQVHNGVSTGEATTVGARVGVKRGSWDLSLFGRNISDEDAITAATRWFDLFQGGAPATGPGSAATGADTGSPRGFFYGLRKGPQFGLEFRIRG